MDTLIRLIAFRCLSDTFHFTSLSDGVEERDKSSGGVDSASDERSLMFFRISEPVPLGRAVGVDSAPSDDISEGQRN